MLKAPYHLRPPFLAEKDHVKRFVTLAQVISYDGHGVAPLLTDFRAPTANCTEMFSVRFLSNER